MDNEPVYVPRSTMVDIIYRCLRYLKSPPTLIVRHGLVSYCITLSDHIRRRGEDELLANRHRGEELIELPSGARQRKIRGRIFEPSCSDPMAGGNSESEMRRRRGGREQGGGGGGQKESLAARESERKQLPTPDLKVFNLPFRCSSFSICSGHCDCDNVKSS